MKLYSYWRSTSAWRVRIGLALKNLECTIVPVHLLRDGGEQRLPPFLARNPLAQVPVLEVEEREEGGPLVLSQSLAILEYLEERYPDTPLLPGDHPSRARVRQLAEIVNSGMQPLQNLRLQQELRGLGLEPVPVLRGFVARGLEALEHHGHANAARFMVGQSPTFADILLIPQLYAARRLGIDIDGGPFPTLRRIEADCATLPAFRQAHPSAQPDFEANAP